MKKEMLINVLQPEECRIAIVEDGVLEELYVERTSHESYVGNIYKGRIVNIEPSIQAAFVDFGVGRNGFLHVSDVEPTYYRHLEGHRQDSDRRGRDRGRAPSQRRGRPEREPARSTEELLQEEFGDVDMPEYEPDDIAENRDEAPTPETDLYSGDPSISDAEALPPEEPESPRFMDSAERRTDEDDPGVDPVEPRGFEDDPDIFFPRTEEPERAEPAPVSFEEPREEARQDLDEPTAEAPEFVEEGEPEDRSPATLVEEPQDDFAPPREGGEEFPVQRERRPRGRDRDSRGPRGRDQGGQRGRDGGRGGRDMGRGGRDMGRGGRDQGRGGPRRFPGRPAFGRPKPLIQDIFKRGQEVLVQVIKEGIGTKGPTLSTYISIAGRYLVLMPGLNRIGVSRKIADDEQRFRLREILKELKPPRGLGFIIRTAGLDKTKKELQRDLAYLSRLWQVVVRRIRKMKGPAEIYQESDMITRTIRDTFTNEIDTIWVDEKNAFEHAQEFLTIVMPRYAERIKNYADSEPMFHRYGIEEEIARIQRRHVPLPNGGSIVIDQTEALVAIDVNSGNFRADNNAEETAYQMNLLAAKEIARQLRLRDLGGVIVNDFIDMREEKHRRGVERAMRDAVQRDRARTKLLRISQFGIIEMTRQRIRPSLKRSVYQDCPHCLGSGQVKTCESMSIDVMRLLQLAAHNDNVQRVQVRVAEEVANYLLNKKRQEITKLEEEGKLQVTVLSGAGLAPETLEFLASDKNNNEVKLLPYEEENKLKRR